MSLIYNYPLLKISQIGLSLHIHYSQKVKDVLLSGEFYGKHKKFMLQ